ncbi:MAG: ABC-F family ATP-binding cassette domain-containing protein [Phycisphaerae bacterium]|nr:ABC-F family ATP-binding cassette domain-containing protein [Phycisphaerales bacterium]
MGLIQLQNVTKEFGSLRVLDGVSVELHSGRITGIVGPNGAGKTTLFRMISGELEPDLGTVTKSRDLKVGYLTQEPTLNSDATLHDEVLSVFEGLLAIEHRMQQLSEEISHKHDSGDVSELMEQYDRLSAQFEAAGGYAHEQRLEEVLGGLGFSMEDRKLPVSALSGGQRCRAALAKLLLQDHNMLLLDEPTNHLDIDAVRWLEKFLAGHHGGAVIISHDRYLMDRVTDRIIEVDKRRLTPYSGNYSNYIETKERNRLSNERQFQKDKDFIEKERAFIAKHMAGQRTKEAQGRQKRLERRLRNGEFVTEVESQRRHVKFEFDEGGALGGEILRVEGLAKSYDGKHLFRDMGFQIHSGQRLGITGPNGTGKSTLIKILQGIVPEDSGTFEWHPRVSVAYFAQDAKALTGDHSLIKEMQLIRPGISEGDARSHLARFNFIGDDAFKPLNVLSGGEQSRVRLIKLLETNPNVLILDEPTNHLDIPSCEALEAALADFPGTIIAVSHDRYFLDRLVNHLLVIRREGYRLIRGNYSDYVELTEKNGNAPAAKSKPSSAPDAGKKKSQPTPAAEVAKRRTDPKFDVMSVEQIEELVIECEERLTAANERFASPEVYRDPERMAQLRQTIDAIRAELEELEYVWHDRVEQA